MTKQSSYRIYHAGDVSLGASAPDPNFLRLLAQLFREVDGDHQDWCLGREIDDVASCVQAVHLRHLEVDHNQIRLSLLEPLDCFFAIAGLVDDVPIGVMIQ